MLGGLLVPPGWGAGASRMGCWLLLGWMPGLKVAVQNSQVTCGGWDLALENVCLVPDYPSASHTEESLVVSALHSVPSRPWKGPS